MKIQIGIDDLCPRPTQGFELWHNVETLLDAGLKVDAFVTFGMVREMYGPYYLWKHPEFVDRLHEVSDRPGFALNVHGMTHGWGERGFPNFSNNDEFLLGDKKTLDERLTMIDSFIEESGLPFKKVFRPPGFKISPDGVTLLKDHGYTHLSLYKGHKTGHYYEDGYSKLDLDGIKVHYSNCAPPADELIDGDLAATYHFSTWMENAISDNNVNDLLAKVEDAEPYHIFET